MQYSPSIFTRTLFLKQLTGNMKYMKIKKLLVLKNFKLVWHCHQTQLWTIIVKKFSGSGFSTTEMKIFQILGTNPDNYWVLNKFLWKRHNLSKARYEKNQKLMSDLLQLFIQPNHSFNFKGKFVPKFINHGEKLGWALNMITPLLSYKAPHSWFKEK